MYFVHGLCRFVLSVLVVLCIDSDGPIVNILIYYRQVRNVVHIFVVSKQAFLLITEQSE